MAQLMELSSEKVIDQGELTKDETEEHTVYMRSPIVITKRLSPVADFFWRLLNKWGYNPSSSASDFKLRVMLSSGSGPSFVYL